MSKTYKSNALEKRINKVNMENRRDGNLLIMKIPVPLKLTNSGIIATRSTVDYSGTLQGGISIDFDAKETENKTSFPLANIEEHQINYLLFKYNLGGISFFLIHFKKVYEDSCFITPIKFVEKYWHNALFNDGRKSMPFKDFNSNWLITIENYINKVKELEVELRKC